MYRLNRSGFVLINLLFSVYFYYHNYFGLKRDAVGLFYTYFTLPKVSVNYRNINTMKYNADVGALNTIENNVVSHLHVVK